MLPRAKLVALDSSTWGNLARDRCKNKEAREILRVLNSGDLFPYLTWHHFEELFQHANDDVYQQRLDLIRSLCFVVYPKTASDNVGCIIDLRDEEFTAYLDDPRRTLIDIVSEVKPTIANGFHSGEALYRTQRDFWTFYRRHLAQDSLREKVTIASLAHFPVVDRKERLPTSKKCSLVPIGQAKAHFQKMAEKLAADMNRAGDPRLKDGALAAWRLMQEAFDEMKVVYQSERNVFEAMLEVYGVKASRLPKNPRVEDISYECIFVQHLNQYGRRRLKSPETTSLLEQRRIPFWIVWREVDAIRKNVGRAAGSELEDRYILPFGLYVDAIEVDRRIKDAVRRIQGKSAVFGVLESRILRHDRGRDYSSLLTELRKLI